MNKCPHLIAGSYQRVASADERQSVPLSDFLLKQAENIGTKA
jgi:hypothetical protein